MTENSGGKVVGRRPETGWSKARRLRGEGIRTCLPAVRGQEPAPLAQTGAEENIVRGED
ncbi:hypothetical protein ACIQAC_22455 [Streptomyces sp. NPDC088387]|uniref:hypothetical protein n=1 Tax=Streptomyces sp. NPDC088387 TaxID=3365859 RepID=UPI0038171C78